MSASGVKRTSCGVFNVRYCFANTPDLSNYSILISPKRRRNPDSVIETRAGRGQSRAFSFMWHPISNAPFDRDLELGVADSHSVRVIPFPCRRILGGWIKAETKTRIDVCPTHWREWSTDRSAPRSPRDVARYRGA